MGKPVFDSRTHRESSINQKLIKMGITHNSHNLLANLLFRLLFFFSYYNESSTF